MKTFLTAILTLSSILFFGQENWNKSNCSKCAENPFTFDKNVVLVMEKYASTSKDYQVSTDELKKEFLGAIIITNETDNLATGLYVKISTIPSTEKFIMIGETSSRILIQNLKTSQFYVLNNNTFNYVDWSTRKSVVKACPKVPNEKEQELLTRYKSLIKTAKVKTVTLGTIQRKYLTRGYFDESKVNAIDKKTYNKTLSELKVIAKQLSDIDAYEDKDDKAQDKLTTAEIATLSDVNNWNHNFFPIN